ncbi:hydroxyacid dehydrogenase [Clostridioides sp. ZZV15-6383]|uniref:hydroxyacid dehydrogenase n=1 Tax=unclassified Clostridioides TaxID=2635829 RepID=UPI0006BBFBE9|nr:hydroxyacid dehydrogenase [Clostridioides difficile]MCC0686346.1 hydroxyacid dehydrogenase [Clostridioides sp. ZZV14-6345]MCC0698012.1 hydroxyacid dehydrogenase [Clostridioides sp. ZZV15-6383]
MGWKILLPQEIMQEGRDYLESRGHELITGSGMETKDIINDIKGIDAIIVRLSKITREVFEAADNLKVIVRHGAGFDTVDLEAAKEFGVQVLYCPVANSTSVAEVTLMYMLYCSRNYTKVRKSFIDDYYKAKLRTPKCELDGKTVGIIGCGNIGSRVAKMCMDGFNMKVVAYDPYKSSKDFPQGVEVTRDINKIYKESDFVSVHCPTTSVTKNFIGKEQFSMMKETAFFINAARGSVVDEQALYEACRDNIIAGAGLDVLQQEPVDSKNPILYLDNVVVSPHIGAATKEATNRASLHSAIGVNEVFEGKNPTWPVKSIDWDNATIYND